MQKYKNFAIKKITPRFLSISCRGRLVFISTCNSWLPGLQPLHGCGYLGASASPHIVACGANVGLKKTVTARAVNIAVFQIITLIRHLTHNRASGCNFNNLTLTTSVAKSATWGKPMNPRGINRRAVGDSAIKVIRVLYAIIGAVVVRGLRFAHPWLSPVGECLRVHVLRGHTYVKFVAG